MRKLYFTLFLWALCSVADAQVDYAFIPGTASVDTPYGPGLRANQNFEATITVANQSGNPGVAVNSYIRYELIPNAGGPSVPLRWRLAEASPLIGADRNIADLSNPNANFALTTILNPPPGITPGTYSLRAILDPGQLQDDSNRANNTNILHSSLTVLATPDIRVESVILPNASLNQLYANEESLTVRVRYENVGDSTAVTPFPVDYFMMPPGYYNAVFLYGNAEEGFVYDITDWQPWDYPDHRIFLGRRTAPGLNPGDGPVDFDQTLTLPSVSVGDFPEWVIGAVVNPDARTGIQTNQLMEATYTNNRAYTLGNEGQIRFAHLAGQGADLRVRENSLFASGTTVDVGGALLFTGMVENVGNQPASEATTMHHYLTPIDPGSGAFLPGVHLLGVSTLPPLPAATILPPAVPVHSWSAQLTVPSTVPGGTYYYWVDVDPNDLIAETNTANNARSIATPITVNGPSGAVNLLTSQTFTNNGVAPWTVDNKGSFTATVEVWNAGPDPSGPFSVRYSLQSLSGTITNTIIGAPFPIGTLAVPQGLPGAQGFVAAKTNLTTVLNVPAADILPPGLYRLLWEVDFLNDVLESNEDDNTGYWGWLTGPASNRLVVVDAEAGLLPDFVPAELSFVPDVIGVGKDPSLVTFTNMIENVGTADSSAFTYQIYLSPDPDPSTTNLILQASRPMPIIPAGDRASDDVTIDLPDDFPVGTYYPVMIIDGNNIIPELDKSNNKVFYGDQPLFVTAQEPTERPHLDVQDFSHSSTDLIPGQPLEYQFTLVNNGITAMAGLMVDIGLNFSGQFQLGPADRVLVEHGPFEIPGEGGSVQVSGSLVFDEPTLEGYAHRVIWAFNRRDPGVDTLNSPLHLARDVTVRELQPRLELVPAGFVGGGPVLYLAFRDSTPGRMYQVQRSSDLTLPLGGFDTLNWTLPPGDPSTALLYGPFNLLTQPSAGGFYRIIDVTPGSD
jgi:hypothetical protein